MVKNERGAVERAPPSNFRPARRSVQLSAPDGPHGTISGVSDEKLDASSCFAARCDQTALQRSKTMRPGNDFANLPRPFDEWPDQFERYRSRSIESRKANRTANFIFVIDDCLFCTQAAYVHEPWAASYDFRSSMTVQFLKSLTPTLHSFSIATTIPQSYFQRHADNRCTVENGHSPKTMFANETSEQIMRKARSRSIPPISPLRR